MGLDRAAALATSMAEKRKQNKAKRAVATRKRLESRWKATQAMVAAENARRAKMRAAAEAAAAGRIYYSGEVSSEELTQWREWLSTRKTMMYFGDYFVKAGIGGATSLPLVNIPVVGPYLAVFGGIFVPPLADSPLDFQHDDFDKLTDYVDDAIEFTHSNNGSVNITIGSSREANEAGSSMFIQYEDQEALIVYSPVSVLEVYNKGIAWSKNQNE